MGSRTINGVVSKQDELSNGITQSMQPDITQTKIESKRSDIQSNEKVMMPLIYSASVITCVDRDLA